LASPQKEVRSWRVTPRKSVPKILSNNLHLNASILNTQLGHPTGTISAYVKAYRSVVTTLLFPCLKGLRKKKKKKKKI